LGQDSATRRAIAQFARAMGSSALQRSAVRPQTASSTRLGCNRIISEEKTTPKQQSKRRRDVIAKKKKEKR
jgi:hypothetical protein